MGTWTIPVQFLINKGGSTRLTAAFLIAVACAAAAVIYLLARHHQRRRRAQKRGDNPHTGRHGNH